MKRKAPGRGAPRAQSAGVPTRLRRAEQGAGRGLLSLFRLFPETARRGEVMRAIELDTDESVHETPSGHCRVRAAKGIQKKEPRRGRPRRGWSASPVPRFPQSHVGGAVFDRL